MSSSPFAVNATHTSSSQNSLAPEPTSVWQRIEHLLHVTPHNAEPNDWLRACAFPTASSTSTSDESSDANFKESTSSGKSEGASLESQWPREHDFIQLIKEIHCDEERSPIANEFNGSHILDLQAIVQLQPSRLVISSDTITRLQSMYDSLNKSSASDERAALENLEAALSILIPLSAKLYAASTIYGYCNQLDLDLDCYGYSREAIIKPIQAVAAKDPRHQFHPFILPWPTSTNEWKEAMKTHLKRAPTTGLCHSASASSTTSTSSAVRAKSTSDLSESAATTSAAVSNESSTPAVKTNIACGGKINAASLLSDTVLHQECQSEYVENSPYRNFARWTCDLKCPPQHRLECAPDLQCSTCRDYSPDLMLCTCHLQLLRGCLWPHCARAEHATIRLITKLLAITDPVTVETIKSFKRCYRPGVRTDWSEFFRVSRAVVDAPPLTDEESAFADKFTCPSMRAFANLTPAAAPELAEALSTALPWSIDGISHGVRYFTATPSFVAAPLAPGWIGGFIGVSNSSASEQG